MTPRHLLLNLPDLRKASPDELEALRKYIKRRGWRRYYDHDRRTYRLLREGMRRFQAGEIKGATLGELVRISRAVGYKLTIMVVEEKLTKTSRPRMTRRLAEKRAVGDSTVSSFNGTAFLASRKK
jgi:hypothetical protein